ncbi:hypothetical protein ROBYS_37800 [Roseobacter sp. OBYS 0001]|nr:hypothetical protein ROBYS_37800 [Roseobacter sp. OBYS 0001]
MHIGPVKAHAAFGQRVDMGCFKARMPRAGQVIPPQLITHDEEDVFCHESFRVLQIIENNRNGRGCVRAGQTD